MNILRGEARKISRAHALTKHFENRRNKTPLNAIKNIIDSLHVSADKAMDILKIDIEKREQLKKLL